MRRKNHEFTHCIDFFMDELGVLNFKIVSTEESENALLQFNTYTTARERLDTWIDNYTLCMSHCGLTAKESSCFNHQIKKCYGICCGNESVDTYNKRAEEIVKIHSFLKPSFVIIDIGRTAEERAVIMVENNKYKGYGYIDAFTQVSEAVEFKQLIKAAAYYPDSNDLVRTWMKDKFGLKIIELPPHPKPLANDFDIETYGGF